MLNYIIRRLLYSIPILFGIALITFLMFNVISLDPVLIMAGRHANAQLIAELREQLGLNKPLYMQFLDFVKQILTFDFGRSYSTKQDVMSMIYKAAPVSFSVAFPGFVLTQFFSISVGLFLAFWRGSWVDKFTVIGAVAIISIPTLSIVLFCQYQLAYVMGLFPISGYSYVFPDAIRYIMLPVIIFFALSFGFELRFYRTVMLDEMGQDYIRTARSKGLNERVIMFKHVLKNAMIPIITNVIIEIPALLTGAILIESFFSIPGMGSQIIDAINSSDIPVIKCQVVVVSLLYMVFNLITDVCYALVDPRVSLK